MHEDELLCPVCGTPLPRQKPTDPLPVEVTCYGCNNRLEVYRFPALLRREENSDSSGVRTGEAEAGCFQHPDKRAEAVCEVCGRFLCSLCHISFNGRTLCPSCLALTQTAQEAHIPRRLRYDHLALLCIAVSPFMYCLSFVNACATLYLCIRHWRTPLSVVPRNRWRFVLASLLSVAVLSLWVMAAVSLANHRSIFSSAAKASQSRSAHVR